MNRSWLNNLLQASLTAVILVATAWLLWPWSGRNIPTASFLPTVTATVTRRAATSTRVPSPTFAVPTATSVPVVHIVQPGEVLGVIAKFYGVTVDAIMTANGIKDSNLVQRGEKLVIPNPQQTPRMTAVQQDPTRTATPTPSWRDIAPLLLSPAEASAFQGPDAVIILTWASTAMLRESEYYRVRLWRVGQGEEKVASFYAATSSWVVPASYYTAGADGVYCWSVDVVYHARRDIPRSPTSSTRCFVWR
jgi:LysM repeat protein